MSTDPANVPPLRLGVLGAGRRVHRLYADVLAAFAVRGLVEVVGIASRTPGPAAEAAARLGCPAHESLGALIAAGKPEAVVLAVPAEARGPLAAEALAYDQHLFIETPAAVHPRGVRALAALAARRGRVVEVAEDQSCSPEACLQRDLVASGTLGRVLAVLNDGQEFYYHACARLGRLLGARAAASWYGGRNVALADGARLQLREAGFADGVVFAHRYGDPKTHPLRHHVGWQVVCERGAIAERLVSWNGPSGVHQAPVAAEGEDPRPGPEGRVARLSVEVDGRTYAWRDPFDAPGRPAWTRQQHGLAHLLAGFVRAVRGGAAPEYGLARAQADIELWRSLELTPWFPVARVPAAFVHCVLAMRP